MAGRAAFADAYPTTDVSKHLAKRTAVAIDRVLGSVAVGPFDFEALVSGQFETTIRLRNFELWQLGLLGLAIRDLCLGRVRIGYGKSRGFGSISARLDKLELRSIAANGLVNQDGELLIRGIGALLGEEAQGYGIGDDEKEPASVTTSLKAIDDLLGASIIFERQADSKTWCAPEAEMLFTNCVKMAWKKYAESHPARGGYHG
jgi:CRISPR/Cas system CSM-associated protein Csm3 (group 7 of RAMP superfamily)